MDKKHRGENWTAEEKEILISIMKDSVRIIQCKKNDTNAIRRKQTEWLKVQKKFQELSGKLRDVAQLKGFWRRLRMVAKKKVFQHRRALHAAGGGERPPFPSKEEQIIVEMCPTDFVSEENDNDIDGIFYKNEIINKKDTVKIESDCIGGPQEIAGLSQQENTILIVDIKDEPQEETSFFEDMIVDENVHNSEVTNKRAQTSMMDRTKNRRKTEKSLKSTPVESNIETEEKALQLLEEEYALKIHYQRQELCHQERRHKLEIDILLLEKEKKEWELKLLKK